MTTLLFLALCALSFAQHTKCDPNSGYVKGAHVGLAASKAYCDEMAKRDISSPPPAHFSARSAEPAVDSYMNLYFNDAHPAACSRPETGLTNEFSALGVTFDNTWPVVHECGNYGVTGQSHGNFITSPAPRNARQGTALTFTFVQAVSVVAIFCGCATPTTISLQCYNAVDFMLNQTQCPLTPELSKCGLQVSATAIQYCKLIANIEGVVCDNMTGTPSEEGVE